MYIDVLAACMLCIMLMCMCVCGTGVTDGVYASN